MAIRKVVKYGDPVLRQKAKEVHKISKKIQVLIDDMIETMRKANGCGLAAVQVGVLRRIVVIETEEGLFELINPKIIAMSGEQESDEGCLSVPGEWGVTKRPMHATVRALNRNGEVIEVTGHGLLAKALCHEVDHLDGIIYTDKVIRKSEDDE